MLNSIFLIKMRYDYLKQNYLIFQLTYSITEDNSPQLFKLLPQDGAVVVQVANSPDREVISPDLNDIYSLKVLTSFLFHKSSQLINVSEYMYFCINHHPD